MKSIRLSACAILLLLASCAMTGVPAFAATARVTVDVGTKDILSTNTLSLGENALVLVKNLGSSNPSDIFVSLHDRRSGEILAGASNFVADVQTSVWTNWSWGETSSVPTVVSRTVTNALGYLPLDTTNLFSRFVGLPVTAERSFILSVYDTSNRWVLGQDEIGVKNAAIYGGLTNGVPVALFPDIIDHIADTNNPHCVTLEQLNHSDELGTLLFAYGINAWLNEGLKYITWTDHRVDLENGTFYGAWNFSRYPPAYEGAKLLTTNDIAPSFTNGTAPSLILSGIPYSRIVNDGLLSLPGVFYVGEPYDQLFVKPAGETASILTLSQDMAQFSKDLRVLQNLSADSFTLDGSTNKLEVLDGDLTYGGEPIGNGQGSGFPLTNNADFASFAATNVGSIQLAGSTNELAVEDGRLRWGGKSVAGVANLTAGRNIELSTNETTEAVTVATDDDVSFGNVQVRGNLTIYGQQVINTVRRYYTNLYMGTNFIWTDVYSTNHVYTYVHEVTRTTNHVDEVVNVGGNVDHSKAASIATPNYTIDNTDTNHPLLSATGEWDFTLASIDFGINAVSALNGWTGPITLAPGSNILFQADAITKTLTILSTNGGTIANAWTTLYDSTGTPKTPTGETPLKIITSTNHAGVSWGTPETIGTNTVEVLSIGLQVAGGGGGSGVWTPTNRIVTATSDYVLPTDYLIWMAGDTNQTLTLPNMAAESQTIIVRQLGDHSTSIIRGTNTWELAYDGDGITIDWLGAATNWYWRAF